MFVCVCLLLREGWLSNVCVCMPSFEVGVVI